jgi:putative inorganic carbon (HCO3(-)) transporter
MNFEITRNYTHEVNNHTKLSLILILSIIFIPAAYLLVAAIFIHDLIKGETYLRTNRSHNLLYAYIAIGLISSSYRIVSAAYSIIIVLCFYSYLIFERIAELEDIKKTRLLLFQVSLIVFLFGIMQYVNPNFAIPNKWVDVSEYEISKRIYSTFYNPNIFGFFINFIIILTLDDVNFKKINLINLVFVSGLICLLLTFSRTAWISLTVALVAASFFNKKYMKFAFIIPIVIFGADAFLGIGRANPLKAVEDSSLIYRLEVWRTCLEIIKDNFISGIGFGTLFKHVANYSNIVSTKIEHSHNLYLQVFTETGALGFSIFSILLYSIISEFKMKLRTDKKLVAAFAVFAMTVVHGMVDSVALTPQIMMILSMYAGTLKAINN